MSILERLAFHAERTAPLVLQTESAECGLACVAMIAGFHGNHTSLRALRARFSVSQKGVNLMQLIKIAAQLNLSTRALKLDVEQIAQLRLPCILHWDLQHFVVLTEVRSNGVTIHDPAHGTRRLSLAELSAAFTGVALELWPASGFERRAARVDFTVRELVGRITGIGKSLGQIIVLAFALEVFALVSPFFLQWVIDDVIVSADRDLLTTLAIGFGLLFLLQQAISAMRAWVVMYMGTTLNVQWRANVFTHLLRLPAAYFEKRHLGDIVSRFGSVDTIQQTLTSSFLTAILDGVMSLVTLVMMFLFSRVLGWIALATMLLYAVARWAWYQPLKAANEEQIIHATKQQSHFLETVRGIKTIKLFMRQDERRAAWLTLFIDQINASLRSQKLQLIYQQVNGLLFGLENLIVIWMGASMVIDGQFTVGVLMAFNSYRRQFDGRVASLIDKYFELRMLQLHGERLADIVLTEPEPHASLADPAAARPMGTCIEAVDVSYRYAQGEPWVLEGVTLKIEEGESVAIIGPSGTGKSTLINVLLGVLPPTAGRIELGGVDTAKLGPLALRDMAGTVMQDDVLFAGSIAENISFFDSQADEAWIVECARRAAIHDEIVAMPMGYQSLVGDMGTILSGGQKQRVLLARALYRRPRILFLDEATSHLDIERERQVNAAIRDLKITRILIAHRPETIASADRVIALAAGKVAMDVRAPLVQASMAASGQVAYGNGQACA
ncbi:peptidase domain-containing ABC transporter [Paraburkholderia solisilvae]|uniref:Cyclolysin secretion/processing ATP-binding protein CyaB n=1 Tax=Paraburkholderia solisilvae TaxID=624376 RepID=A0A6J5DKN1_9BURK|nr:peptidase domain-containing ABC transporter [Paraburkholderia solisilvae]CAB3753575.1 Toxin RTX-I translocation ATP-binding protein [Paraburkholderia solisilvae]